MAQTIRAILLARATGTSFGGFRAANVPSQEPACSGFRPNARTTLVAPMINNRRKISLPAFVIAPSLSFPPVEF